MVNFHDRVRSDIFSKEIEGSIKNTSLKKLSPHLKEHNWEDSGGLIMSDIPEILYLLLKRINPDTRIGVSNLKDETEKSTISKFGNNEIYIIHSVSYNYTISIDKGGCYEGFVRHLFRDIFSGPNSTFNSFVEIKKDYCYTGSEVLASDLINNSTDKHNNTETAK